MKQTKYASGFGAKEKRLNVCLHCHNVIQKIPNIQQRIKFI